MVNLSLLGIFGEDYYFLKPLTPYSEERECFAKIPHNEVG